MSRASILALVLVVSCSGAAPSSSPQATATLASPGAPSPSSAREASPTPSGTLTPSASPRPSPAPQPTPSPTAVPPSTALPRVTLERSFAGLSYRYPIGAYEAPDGSWLVLEQGGRIMRFGTDASSTVFLDISPRVTSGGELGLLGLALAPDFPISGVFFVNYTAADPLRTVISSFTSRAGVADPASEAVILTVSQPYPNHNGGQLAFGPDGFLYIGLGDGGSGGDPQGNGQNKNALLGKILRIDVRDRTHYVAPADNPFASGGGRPEIWAYGLRNPWRFSFDRGGTLWAGDVGQNEWEEIDLVTKGGNYGWNVMEGTHCYGSSSCDRTGLTLPIFEYSHAGGNCSITGGFVYRGPVIPSLGGAYVYADYCTGLIWALRSQGGRVTTQAQIASAAFQIGSLAQGLDGEIFVLQYSSSGRIFHVAP